MNSSEQKMAEMLFSLKENHHAAALKAEFEAEGASFEDAALLKKLADEAGLDFIVKIGGCAAVRDLFDLKSLGVNSVVAPMIETEYALEKFVRSAGSVFGADFTQNLYINIETAAGVENASKIINSEYFARIKGVVFGRNDLCESLGNTEDVESEKILKTACDIAEKTHAAGKKFVLGGKISTNSVPFLEKMQEHGLDAFETRKIKFDVQKQQSTARTADGIKAALDFELFWLKSRLKTTNSPHYTERYRILEERLKFMGR